MEITQIQGPVFQLNRAEFREILKILYGLDENQIHRWFGGLINTLQRTMWFVENVTEEPFEEYEAWLKEVAPPNECFSDAVWEILGDAVNRHLIPVGSYIVDLGF